MFPSFALLCSFLFSFFANISFERRDPYPSRALWVPTLWMIRCGSRGIDSWIGYVDSETGRWDPVLLAILAAAGLVLFARRNIYWGQAIADNFLLLAFYSYLILSVIWATSLENPAIKLLRPVGDLLMALCVISEINPFRAIITLFRRTSVFLIPLSIVLIKYFPSTWSRDGQALGSRPVDWRMHT